MFEVANSTQTRITKGEESVLRSHAGATSTQT